MIADSSVVVRAHCEIRRLPLPCGVRAVINPGLELDSPRLGLKQATDRTMRACWVDATRSTYGFVGRPLVQTDTRTLG